GHGHGHGHFGYYYAWHGPYHHYAYTYPRWGLYFGFGVSYYGPSYSTVFVDATPYGGPGEVVYEEVVYEEVPVGGAQPAVAAPAAQPPLEQPLGEAPAFPEPSGPDADEGDFPAGTPHPDFEPSVNAFLGGDYAGALKRLDNVVRDEPDNGEAWLAVMHANFALGRYGPAGLALAKAGELQAFPRGYQFDPRPLYARQQGSYDTYVLALAHHIAANPQDADARLVRAYLHVASGERAEARAAIDGVLEVRPADETAPLLALALLPPPPPPVKGGPVAPPAAK
ncbi:MAG: tetratricopeptide repeat protein, partial [Planctomycetota bacterium]|nr:tetratricopeptide repeat protein [Planctomycetota bacterium]